MPTNMPGGRILSAMGSFINVINPFNGNLTRLDVLSSDLDKIVRLWRRGHSGTLSAIAARAIAQTFDLSLRVWWDCENSPCVQLLQAGWGCGAQLSIGSLAGQQMYGIPTAIGQQQFWYLPHGILQRLRIHQNTEGDEADGIATGDALIAGNTLPFLLPDELSACNLYLSQLQALGQFNALPAFLIMQQTVAL
jgi:hypothetical protein